MNWHWITILSLKQNRSICWTQSQLVSATLTSTMKLCHIKTKWNSWWLESRQHWTRARVLKQVLPLSSPFWSDEAHKNAQRITARKPVPLWFFRLRARGLWGRTILVQTAAVQTGRFERKLAQAASLRAIWQRRILPVVEHAPTRPAIKKRGGGSRTQTLKPPVRPENPAQAPTSHDLIAHMGIFVQTKWQICGAAMQRLTACLLFLTIFFCLLR